MKKRFNAVVDAVIKALGSPVALVRAAVVIAVWAITGPIFGFSDTWQLFINTGTTIVTFLMVFVIQNSQNRDSKAIHIKLDELIESMEGARNRIALAEHETEEEQDRDIEELREIARREGLDSESASKLAEKATDSADRKASSRRGSGNATKTESPAARQTSS